MNTILNTLYNSPNLPFIYEEIKLKLSEESKSRVRFLSEISDNVKAEFINGDVILHSPVKLVHNNVSGNIFILMKYFIKKYDMGIVGIEKLMISLSRNDYEPDLCFFSKEKAKKFTKKQMRFPAPDLIVEILSETTEKFDRGIKFEDYAAHKIQEYWLIDAEKEILEQYILNNEIYELYLKSDSGIVKSRAIKGFQIPIRAIFDEKENMKVLQEMMSNDK
jgi:Uma2 family endonuclease